MSETKCNCCGWPLESDEHVFNVKCVASNAEYDQVQAEAAEAQQQQWTEEDERGYWLAMERVREVLAYQRFLRDLQT